MTSLRSNKSILLKSSPMNHSGDTPFLWISRDILPKSCIILRENPSVSAKLAARELQYHLDQVIGIQLPISTKVPPDSLPIFVGRNNSLLEFGIDLDQLTPQEYLIEISATRIILGGKDWEPSEENLAEIGKGTIERLEASRISINYQTSTGYHSGDEKVDLPGMFDDQGTCYAVYDFLERFLGVRWYGPHPNNVHLPQYDEIYLPILNFQRSPAIKHRESTGFAYSMIQEQFFNADQEIVALFKRRLRMGGEKWCGNHSLESYPDRFFKKKSDNFEEYHPEYRGKKCFNSQFCYTNENLINQVAADARDYFDGQGLKGMGVGFGNYFAVVPRDNGMWCKCKTCQKALKKDRKNIRGSHFGSGLATHYFWNFVNEIAKKVKVTHPDKFISALSYHVYSFLPTDFPIESNISVAPCLHTRYFGWGQLIKKNEMDYYRAWVNESKQTGRPIYLWNYYCHPTEFAATNGFKSFPGFCAHLLDEQIKLYHKDNIRGVFLCGPGEQLEFYVSMKMYDDPTLDVDQVLDEFFTKYFGRASQPMKKFYTLIENRYNDPKNYPTYITRKEKHFHLTEEICWGYLGTDQFMAQIQEYILEAENLAEDTLEKSRVQSWKKGILDWMKEGKNHYASNKMTKSKFIGFFQKMAEKRYMS